MKTHNKILHKFQHHSEAEQERDEAAEFHSKRIHREMRIEAKKDSPMQPQGNDEYEQLIAENADFNTKPMIEEAAFFIAEHRGFVPGSEMSDWLQAEAHIESTLRSTAIERRKAVSDDRRDTPAPVTIVAG